MNNLPQKIDHSFPKDIEESINNFRKTQISHTKKSLIRGLSVESGIKIINTSDNAKHLDDLLYNIHKHIYNQINNQIKNGLDIGEKKLFGIRINKNIASYNSHKIIELFKEKLRNVPNAKSEDDEKIEMDFFIIINNLAMYLSNSGAFITSEDYEEMEQIIASKGANFTMGVLKPELEANINQSAKPMNRLGEKSFIEIGNFAIGIGIPKISLVRRKNSEAISTLKSISKALGSEGGQKLLPGVEQSAGAEMDTDNIDAIREEVIKNESKKFKGHYSIGGKIHFAESIPEEKIEAFKRAFGFESTGFKLIHSNTSLLLPPSCSPNIVLFYILALEKSGLISGEPDLQVCIPGRLPNRAAGILGSTVLFASDTHREYAINAFSTNQDSLTGARIMAYDAGVLNNEFKHNASNVTGRTDMLGIVDINDIYTYHMVGSIISQAFYGGKYAKIGKDFIKEYIAILTAHNIQGIVEEERIYDGNNDNTISAQKHYELIKSITDKQKENRETFLQTKSKDGLIVFEIKELLNKYRKKLNYKK